MILAEPTQFERDVKIVTLFAYGDWEHYNNNTFDFYREEKNWLL